MNNTVNDGQKESTGESVSSNATVPGTPLAQTVDRTLSMNPTLRTVKRVIVAVFGGTILLLGIALLVLPGPAFVVIPTGLAVLAIEFRWARRWLRKVKSLIPGQNKRRQNQPSKPSTK